MITKMTPRLPASSPRQGSFLLYTSARKVINGKGTSVCPLEGHQVLKVFDLFRSCPFTGRQNNWKSPISIFTSSVSPV